MIRLPLWISSVLTAAVLAVSLHAQDTIENFKVPDYNEKGEKTSEMIGKTARFLRNGKIEITGLEIEFYENDQVKARMKAPQCIYDQRKEEATSDGDVEMERDNLVVTGKGFTYSRASQVFKIHNKARVVIANVSKLKEESEKE